MLDFLQVILILGVTGACRKIELKNITLNNVEDTGKSYVVKIPDTKTKIERSFVV